MNHGAGPSGVHASVSLGPDSATVRPSVAACSRLQPSGSVGGESESVWHSAGAAEAQTCLSGARRVSFVAHVRDFHPW